MSRAVKLLLPFLSRPRYCHLLNSNLNYAQSSQFPRRCSSSSQDKLVYFEFRGRGEPIRMIYAVAGKPLVDERMSITADKWMKAKSEQPLEQVPVFTCPEGTLVQSSAIARYAAKKFGLAGQTPWEEALNDMVMETCAGSMGELSSKVFIWKFLKKYPKPENAEQIIAERKAHLIRAINFIQRLSEERGRKFIVNDDISLADISLYSSLEIAQALYPDIMELNQWVKDFVAKMSSDERMKKYLDERPPPRIPI